MVGLMERKKHRQVSFIISLCRVNKSVCDTDIVSLWRSACHPWHQAPFIPGSSVKSC